MISASTLLDPGNLTNLIATAESRIRLQDQSADLLPFCLQIPLGRFNILSWLRSMSDTSRYYWSNREKSFEFGGMGNVLHQYSWRSATLPEQIDELQSILRKFETGAPIKAFVGGAFDPEAAMDEIWQGIPRQCIHLPELCVIREDETVQALITILLDRTVDQQDHIDRVIRLAQRLEYAETLQECDLCISRTHDVPDQGQWKRAVETSIAAINNGQIKKIVLARRTDYTLQQQVDPIDLLNQLSESAANCYRILYAPAGAAAFLSVSPERLFLCRGRLLSTEAVAGTVRRGVSEIEDLALENRLRTNAKDHAEQSFVVEGIADSLSTLCEKVEYSATALVMKLSCVQHLVSEFRAIMNRHATMGDAFSALHPTAAVCGTPREWALELLRDLESFDRGWYASPIGVVGIDQCEFAVGIRSAVLRRNSLSLFTGAGIVRQSDPQTEWQELEDKLQSVLPGGIGQGV